MFNTNTLGFRGILRPFFSLLTLAFLLSVMGLKAQTASAPSEAQLDQDVQLLLANDDNVAALRQRLGAKEITNVEYTKELQALTATRNEIVKGYDRPGYQKLLALYNAAKRDKQLAAAEAKRQAATEARAKAAADKEAARQAAIKAAEEKAAAAKAEAQAQAQALEEDSQAAAKNHLRQAELRFKQFMGTGGSGDQQELQALLASAGELTGKYATGGALQNRAREFQQKSNQVFQAQFPMAGKQWLTEAFPDVSRIKADYSNDVKRDAALNFLANLLALKVGNPLPDFTDQKIRQYGGASERSTFEKSSKLAKDPEFQLEVVKRYLPVYERETAARIENDRMMAKQKEIADKVIARQKFVASILSLLLLAIIGGALFMAFRVKSAPPTKQSPGPLQLPDSLALVKVFRKEYGTEFEGGLVYEKEVWTETNVSTTTSGGGSYNVGNTVYSNPVQTTTHVSTTVYHRYWMRTPDGKETWRRFADNVFPAAKGHIISTISVGTDVLLAYNHTTGQFAELLPGINKANQFKGRWIIIGSVLAWLVGSWLLVTVLGAGNDMGNKYITGGAMGIAFFICILVVVLKIVFGIVRKQQFKSRYSPQFRKFMEQVTPELTKQLPPAPAVSQA